MKISKLIWFAWCAAVFAAIALVGCEGLEPYEIDSPDDLQHKIDSIAAIKDGMNTGDTTYITISTTIVGAEDNSAVWWTSFSDYFTIPANKLLHIEFVNNGTGVNNWNNWNVAVANVADREAEEYAEYFVLRSDAYGWGNADYDGNMIDQNYPDTNGDDDIWNDFRETMQGAYVTLEIDHSPTGNAFVTATAVGKNGTELVMTYNQPVSATADIVAFLVCDGSHFVMKKAYLLPSRVTAVEDVNPVSIAITGAPAFVEKGDENFWGNAVATVTFADGSSAPVDSADISFNVIPDMTTTGVKTVVAAYSKTKQGKYGPPVSTVYTLEVTNAVTSLAVTTPPIITTYYYFNNAPITFNPKGLEVAATYSDGSTGVMPHESLQFGKITAATGTQSALISYVGATKTVTTTAPLTLVKGTSQVGATDFSTPWPTSSNAYTVASGSSRVITLYCYSNNLNNWNSPSVAVGKAGNLNVDMLAANPASAVVRMDNFGWGPGYAGAVLTSNWNWATFASNISGSKIVITVTNHGNNTADILYNVTYANGETHFQKYAGITVDSSDLTCALVTEGAYLVIVD
ncbi:hypothetical protein [Pseudochryseolinea flava]|uniref:Ig-like domain-containing protein n=1 Tax=Pseudochryseolinea flava TaxID=2059302 RepID=A0A364XW16_9BACT|nr:hypothetical protein [Pseudochryseolinea flava]RAV97920.1 hypothetical protein DQQ10_25950 [Pseudochryseolinea flava]